MILCDIGNSFYHFYKNGKVWKISNKQNIELAKDEEIYYISVNDKAEKKLKKLFPSALNLKKYAYLDTEYVGLGIDRKVACIAVEDGVIVDAGSAITVDIMQNSMHLGGYILPGFDKFRESYKHISPKLDKKINVNIDLVILPQNTADAISYGMIASIVTLLKKTIKNKKVYFTGGDGAYLAKYFDRAVVDNLLIFKGMQKIIKDITKW